MRVAVAGFGIGGATLSIALARDGHEVTVYERAGSLGPVGAGFLLQPSGQAALAQLGLLDDVETSSWRIRRFNAESATGRLLSELRYDRRDPFGHALGVARGRLFTVLHTAALKAGVALRTNVTIVGARETGAEVAPVDGDGTRLKPVDLLVGADGMRSALRAVVDPRARLRLSPFAALWGLGTQGSVCREVLHQQARGVGLLAGHLPVGQREAAVFWGLRASELGTARREGFPTFVDRVAGVLPEAREVLESIGSFDGLLLARFGHATVRRRHTDRIVLIGDAAHPAPPHLGQGANLALLDAIALASAIREGRSVPEALEAWDRVRTFQNTRYLLLARVVSPFFQSSHTWLARPRDVGLPILTRVPPMRAIMERVLAGNG